MDKTLKQKLEKLINQAPVMLFMKGDKYLPKCGYSAAVVQILNELGADYTSYDILEDQETREGLKEYSNWPTHPQLYVKGKLIGGCDVAREMYHNGELQKLLQDL